MDVTETDFWRDCCKELGVCPSVSPEEFLQVLKVTVTYAMGKEADR